MSDWLQQAITLLPDGALYYTLILLIAFLESIPLVGLAMPGSTLMVLAGFLAAHDKGDPLYLFYFCSSGAFLGDFASYWLGGRLGQHLVTSPWLKKRHRHFLAAESFFAVHGGKSLFYARFLGPIRGTIPFLVGMSKMKPAYFSKMTLASSVLWGIFYLGAGYLGGESWQRASDLSSRIGLLVLLAFGLSVLRIWLKRKTR